MFDLKILDVVISVVFFYTFAALICSTIRELIESSIPTKGRMLEAALRELLDDPKPGIKKSSKTTLVQFYEHPLIDSLFRGDYTASRLDINWLLKGFAGLWRYFFGNRKLPAYIPANHFSGAVLEIFARAANVEPEENDTVRAQKISRTAAALIEPDTAPDGQAKPADKASGLALSPRLARAIVWAFDNAEGDIEKARANLESWYDNSMERVTGWYKRRTQNWLLIIGAIIAFSFNMNSIDLIQRLYDDDALRAAVVSEAIKASETAPERQRSDKSSVDQTTSVSAPVAPARPGSRLAKPPAPLVGGTERPGVTAQEPAAEGGGAAAVDGKAKVDAAMQELKAIGYPVGWTDAQWRTFVTLAAAQTQDLDWYSKMGRYVGGWLLTAIAMTLGAPFWFDLLNKLAPLRTSLKPSEKTAVEESAASAADLLRDAGKALLRAEGANGRAEAALRTAQTAQAVQAAAAFRAAE